MPTSALEIPFPHLRKAGNPAWLRPIAGPPHNHKPGERSNASRDTPFPVIGLIYLLMKSLEGGFDAQRVRA